MNIVGGFLHCDAVGYTLNQSAAPELELQESRCQNRFTRRHNGQNLPVRLLTPIVPILLTTMSNDQSVLHVYDKRRDKLA